MKNLGRPSQCITFVALAVLLLSTSGCFLAPFISGFQELGATPSGRQQLLTDGVKKYTEALFWGNPSKALTLVDEPIREQVAADIKSFSSSKRMVESKVIDISFEDSSYRAVVNVQLKYYEVPVYVVKDQVEQQEWMFSFSEGWKLKSRSRS